MSTRRTALITGSTSGIGLAMARSMAGAGYDVMLNGLGSEADIASAIDTVGRDLDVRVAHHPANMLEPEQIAAMVRDTQADMGGVDVLVNNAGIQHVSPIESFPDDAWHRIIAINLSAAFFATREALPAMRERGWGRIVNTASVHGLVASVEKAAYVSAKHGIVGLTRVTALETAGSGITCNAICPGWVRTELVERQIEARAEADGIDVETATARVLGEKQPSGQFATAEQIGGLLVFLCSDSAAQITGTSMPVDGGWTCR